MFSGPPESFPRLVGDIGGTNARFALIEGPQAPVSHIATLACADYPGPLEAIRAYLARTPTPPPRHGAIGVANPVDGDQMHLTNSPWSFSIEALRAGLALDRLLFMNDFTALALSLPHLGEDDRFQVGGGTPIPGAAIGVIGPGTGLGVSGLIPTPAGYVPLSGEGGHTSLAAHTDEELAIVACLTRQFGHVSAERILSGPGLVTLYRTLAEVRGLPAAAQIDSAAISAAGVAGTDPLCQAALGTFCALLGSTAGSLALTLGARGGIFIGGGIVPRLGEYFILSPFRARFEAKGRMSALVAQVPTFVIMAPHPALTGAAVALDQAVGQHQTAQSRLRCSRDSPLS